MCSCGYQVNSDPGPRVVVSFGDSCDGNHRWVRQDGWGYVQAINHCAAGRIGAAFSGDAPRERTIRSPFYSSGDYIRRVERYLHRRLYSNAYSDARTRKTLRRRRTRSNFLHLNIAGVRVVIEAENAGQHADQRIRLAGAGTDLKW